jgi:dsDNA-specific endonuclease/ATPase MutS2
MDVGDKVMVLDDDMEGIVLSISVNAAIIETLDGFEIEYSKKELVVISEMLSRKDFDPENLKAVISEKENFKVKNSRRVKPKERTQPLMEVDLHIHQLVATERGLQSHDKLEIQIDMARRQLEFAINKGIQRVVFIHGIGAGVLRAELEYLLRRYDNVSFEDANFQKYGRGATQVYIYQNPK